MSDEGKKPKRGNGKLKIELPFDEALRAALETPPPKVDKPTRRVRKKRRLR